MEMDDPIEYWKGEFGRAYQQRNKVTEKELDNRWKFWKKVLNAVPTIPDSFLEIGAGNGANIKVLDQLLLWRTTGKTSKIPLLNATEPNLDANVKLTDLPLKYIYPDYLPYLRSVKDNQFEFVYTYGVLIHVNPRDLRDAIDEMIRVSSKYIMCAEYFAPECEELEYRGMDNLLWRNNFGKFFLDKELSLIDYGFMWKEATGLDNITYWVFRK